MIIDGLQCGYFDREVFQSLLKGDVGCVTITLGFWEDAVETMDAIARWRDLERENGDLVAIARSAADIREISRSGRLAIILGSQNSNLFNGRIRFVELFHDLGVRVVQLTYNNQNEYGGSCYEPSDSGLSRAGRELVREMNAAGVLIDLSHVGDRTSIEAIEVSQKPVAVTHANPHDLVPHPRNKSSDVLRALKANGGIIGCAAYRNICGEEHCRSVAKWCEIIAHTVEIAGIDHVGIGTDRSHNTTVHDLNWMRMGRWTRGVDYGAGSAAKPGRTPPADWFTEVSAMGTIPEGLKSVGFSQTEIDKLVSGNWLRVYETVFGA